MVLWFTNIQTALDAAAPGDTILLAGQPFTLDQPLVPRCSNLTILGGHAAVGDDGSGSVDAEKWPTVITRDPSVQCRLMTIESLENIALRGIDFMNGYQLNAAGGGLYATFVTNLQLSDIRFIGNTAWRAAQVQEYGGIWASGALLTLRQATIIGNALWASGQFKTYGGGLGAIRSGLLVTDCLIASNYNRKQHHCPQQSRWSVDGRRS